MEYRCFAYGSPEYQAQLELRNQVLRLPLGLSIWDDDRSGEEQDLHIGAFDGPSLAGSLILTRDGEHCFRMRQVAVSPSLQRGGIGRGMVAFAEKQAKQAGGRRITLHARAVAVGFYQKCGYRVTGEEFLEKGIPHYPMEKALE